MHNLTIANQWMCRLKVLSTTGDNVKPLPHLSSVQLGQLIISLLWYAFIATSPFFLFLQHVLSTGPHNAPSIHCLDVRNICFLLRWLTINLSAWIYLWSVSFCTTEPSHCSLQCMLIAILHTLHTNLPYVFGNLLSNVSFDLKKKMMHRSHVCIRTNMYQHYINTRWHMWTWTLAIPSETNKPFFKSFHQLKTKALITFCTRPFQSCNLNIQSHLGNGRIITATATSNQPVGMFLE